MKTITVYGAASALIDGVFNDAARETGAMLARAGYAVMCGGGATGLMAAAVEGALGAGGRAVGVLPRFMVENGWDHPGLSSRVVVETMHERKRHMLDNADGVIALPGGTGTLEELLEAVTWRQLNLWRGPIVILNTLGYYDPLLEQLRSGVAMGFMQPDHGDLWSVADTPARAVAMATVPDTHAPFSQKIPCRSDR